MLRNDANELASLKYPRIIFPSSVYNITYRKEWVKVTSEKE